MSGLRGIGTSLVVLAVTFLAAAPSQAAESYCPNGAVNTLTNNYAALGGDSELEGGDSSVTQCEICLNVRVQDAGAPGGWEQVATVCRAWSDAQVHLVMFKIGHCGLIVPAFERAGLFYGPTVPIRIDAVRASCR